MDYLDRVSQPFQMDQGGYYVRFKGGKPSQVFGEKVPNWRRKLKEHGFSRAGHLADMKALKRMD
jgi:hypothetical protein